MLIECLIERDGFTTVTIQRSKYDFERNADGDQVCDILSASHSEYLLKLKDFRLYQPQAVEAVEVETPKELFTCEKCGKSFTHRLALSGHKRSKDCTQ
jgi:hypothetical protein